MGNLTTPGPNREILTRDLRELLWAVYSAIRVLETSSNRDYRNLAKGWQAWLDYTKTTAAKASNFYHVLTQIVRRHTHSLT